MVVEKAGAGNKVIPTLDDPVSVLPSIGPETLQKLMDIGATAAAKGHTVPFTRIATGMCPFALPFLPNPNFKP